MATCVVEQMWVKTMSLSMKKKIKMENLGQALPDPALERLGNVSFRHVYLILAVIPNWVPVRAEN